MKTKRFLILAMALAGVGCGSDNKDLDEVLGGGQGNATTRDGGKSGSGGKLPDGGKLADGGSGGKKDDVCGKHSVKSDHAIPDMLIVLDRSTSMTPQGNNRRTNRWQGSATAVTELTNMYGAGVNFGLMTFPGSQGGGLMLAQCAPGELNVAIGPDNGPAIQQAIARTSPNGYTPTAATLQKALDVIGSPTVSDQKVTSAKYVLLVTDGDPNCSSGWNPGGGGGLFGGGGGGADLTARMETIAAIEKLTEAGVSTYVVGYETAGTDFEGALDQMAAAGGTGETKHRSVESAADLSATFEELAAAATTCSYRLSEAVEPTFVEVTVSGKQRNLNQKDNGWTLGPDNRTVTLQGQACEDAKKGGVFTVEVTCNPVIAI